MPKIKKDTGNKNNKKWKRSCLECKKVVFYKNKYEYNRSVKNKPKYLENLGYKIIRIKI